MRNPNGLVDKVYEIIFPQIVENCECYYSCDCNHEAAEELAWKIFNLFKEYAKEKLNMDLFKEVK